jgi:hypothetical protein
MTTASDSRIVHQRSIEYSIREDGALLRATATLLDRRPSAEKESVEERVHSMELRFDVRTADFTIERAEAVMHVFPHVECPGILGAIVSLAGIRIGRGYGRALRERFGGPLGCSHLMELARGVGPVLMQTHRVGASEVDPAQRQWQVDSCHVWVEDGPGMQKLALGWRPSTTGLPAPSVADLRARAETDDGRK